MLLLTWAFSAPALLLAPPAPAPAVGIDGASAGGKESEGLNANREEAADGLATAI